MLEERKGIIAVDFDGTLCENKWPEIGEANQKLIANLIEAQNAGVRVILWTCRVNEMLANALEWCAERGLTFDAINDNLPEIVEQFGSNCRKIFADVYIDDKNSTQFILPFETSHGDMLDWAEAEVQIACAIERGDSGTNEGERDYGVACYESALRAFYSLCQDGHSDFSIGLTKQILVRLIEGKTLTPIDDIPEIWEDVSEEYGCHMDEKLFQCKRMSSLFKTVHGDGTITYSDNERYYCKDVVTDSAYRFGFIGKIVDEMYPITLPYISFDKSYVVTCEDFLFNQKTGGDFDTFGVLYLTEPNGNRVDINRFFKEKEVGHGFLEEISKEEYENRRANKKVREIIQSGSRSDNE